MAADLTQRLQSIGDYDFEHFVADLWERQGWDTTVSQSSFDAGIDVIARKDDLVEQTLVIQAKRYGPITSVSGPDVQQYASLKDQVDGADGVVIVTTGPVTSAARDRANDLNVKLIGGDELASLVREYGMFDLVNKYAPRPESGDAAMATGDTTQPPRSSAGSRSDPESLLNSPSDIWRNFKEWKEKRAKRRPERELDHDSDADESAPHRGVYGERIPRTTATYLLYYGLAAWTFFMAVVLIRDPSPYYEILGVLLITGWLGLFIGMVIDADTVARYSEWQPIKWGYGIAFAIPVLNVIAGLVYVVSRYAHSAAANGELDLDGYNDQEATDTPAE